MTHIGGFTNRLDATEETQKICEEVSLSPHLFIQSAHTTDCCAAFQLDLHHIYVVDQQVKDQVQERTKKTYEEFIAIQYRKQILAEANYIIKVNYSVMFVIFS